MILTIRPFGAVDQRILNHLAQELSAFGQVVVTPPQPVPATLARRKKGGREQYLASEFEKASAGDTGDRILAVTNVDLYDRGLNFVFGHAMILDRLAVISIARFGDDGDEKLMERTVKTAIHELGHTFGLYHDDANPDCVMHFSERLEDTDRKGREFCKTCGPSVAFTLSKLGT